MEIKNLLQIFKFFLLALSVSLLTGCAGSLFQKQPPAVYEVKPLSIETGRASFYTRRFTASGERYNKDALTAAHRSLKFNTIVKVTNLNNGKSVIVRINDRGPYAKRHLIDLSWKAAEQLGMMKDGVDLVRIEVLKPIHVMTKTNLREASL